MEQFFVRSDQQHKYQGKLIKESLVSHNQLKSLALVNVACLALSHRLTRKSGSQCFPLTRRKYSLPLSSISSKFSQDLDLNPMILQFSPISNVVVLYIEPSLSNLPTAKSSQPLLSRNLNPTRHSPIIEHGPMLFLILSSRQIRTYLMRVPYGIRSSFMSRLIALSNAHEFVFVPLLKIKSKKSPQAYLSQYKIPASWKLSSSSADGSWYLLGYSLNELSRSIPATLFLFHLATYHSESGKRVSMCSS